MAAKAGWEGDLAKRLSHPSTDRNVVPPRLTKTPQDRKR